MTTPDSLPIETSGVERSTLLGDQAEGHDTEGSSAYTSFLAVLTDPLESRQPCITRAKTSRLRQSCRYLFIPIKRACIACYSACASRSRKAKRWFQKTCRCIGKKWKNWIVVRKIETALPGWELGVAVAIGVAMFTLSLNLWFLVGVSVKHKPRSNGLGTLQEGNCDKIDWANKILHGVINTLSTILIAQSNFCMQILASPTRMDVDAAHKKRQWVDIGIPSFRNVWKRHIPQHRIALWIMLALGSIPLHLLWNSAIVFSPIAYQYNQLLVSEGFTRGLPVGVPGEMIEVEGCIEGPGALWPDNIKHLQQALHSYERLDNYDCKKNYAQYFILDRSDVVVVTKPTSMDTNTSVVLGGNSAGWGLWPYQWLCPLESRQKLACAGGILANGENWTFPNFGSPKVDYCLSKREDKKCRLEYGFLVTVLTVLANALKLACFIMTYWTLKRDAKIRLKGAQDCNRLQPLVTTGDAIASFLEFEDKETLGMSIVEKEDFINGIWDHRWVQINPMQWQERLQCSRFRAIGVRRWLIGTISLFVIPLYPMVFLLSKKTWLQDELGLNGKAIRDLGIGNPSGIFLFGAWNGIKQIDDSVPLANQVTRGAILRRIAIANTPQLILSVAFYIWNSHLTVMTAARDYDEFAASTTGDAENGEHQKPRHSLRVTYLREGSDQRTTYFFAIPFKHWILVTTLWTILHWLASQAIFFARVDLIDHWHKVTEFSISQVGYSVLGMICFLIVALIIFLLGLIVSINPITNRMPLAATCSAALSAACHPRQLELRHHFKKVHWGVEVLDDGSSSDDGITTKRCTFTSVEAQYPTSGQFYA